MSNSSNDPFAGFTALLRRALGDRLVPEATDFVTMMAEDGVMEFPYAPSGGVHSLRGRAELSAYLEQVGSAIEVTSFGEPRVHHTTDPHVVILEFGAEGRGVKTGQFYKQAYVSVITVRNGHIEHYRDYWNPFVGQQELGGLKAPGAGQSVQARP